MSEGQVLDVDQQTFPDPLTTNYNNGRLTKIPTEYRITARDLAKFWTFMWEQYGMTDMDDVFLNMQGIRYVMDLEPNDVVYKVAPTDIEGYITTKQLGIDE
jgi:hypothetical protein